MEKEKLLEIYSKAIESEIEAASFYARLSGIIINERAKKMMEELHSQELGHKETLLKQYTKHSGGAPFKMEDVKEREIVDFSSLEKGVTQSSSAMQLISIGIQSERDALEYYKNAAERTDDEDKKIFEELAKMEEAHLLKLQNEYTSLNKGYYWDKLRE